MTDADALLAHLAALDRQGVVDDWQDEASRAALAGNPRKADYLEFMAGRFLSGAWARKPGPAPPRPSGLAPPQ